MDGDTLEWGDARLVPSLEDEPAAYRGELDLRVCAVGGPDPGRDGIRRIRVRLACRFEAGRPRGRADADGATRRVEFDGFGRPASFAGEIEVVDGTLLLEGALDGVRLRLRLAFDESAFRPEEHLFGSFEEAAAFAPERVRCLRVARLDDRVLDLVALRELEIVPSPPEAGIGDVPDSLAALGALHTLVVRGRPPGRPGAEGSSARAEPPTVPGLDALLARVPELAALSNLSVWGCRVPTLPEGLAATRLRALTLGGCALERVPDALLEAPELGALWLRGNRLRTLPELSPRSGLVRIGIEDNPFESLPRSLARLWPEVHVERGKKAMFMDTGFDARGPHPVDRAPLLARSDPGLARDLAGAIDASPALAPARDAILALARRSVFLTPTAPEDYAAPGTTRFGGRPDLPPDVAHPASDAGLLGFYAQLDLEALAPFQDYLPRRGLLSFFVGDEESLTPVAVLHLAGPRSDLVAHDYGDAPRFDYIDEPYEGYRAHAVPGASLPPTYAPDEAVYGEHAGTLERLGDASYGAGEADPYAALATRFGEPARGFGAHVVNALVPGQGEAPETLAATALGGDPDDWVVLLCLDSVPGTGMSFCDAGTLSFSIHRSDLAIGDFSRVFASIESS